MARNIVIHSVYQSIIFAGPLSNVEFCCLSQMGDDSEEELEAFRFQGLLVNYIRSCS